MPTVGLGWLTGGAKPVFSMAKKFRTVGPRWLTVRPEKSAHSGDTKLAYRKSSWHTLRLENRLTDRPQNVLTVGPGWHTVVRKIGLQDGQKVCLQELWVGLECA